MDLCLHQGSKTGWFPKSLVWKVNLETCPAYQYKQKVSLLVEKHLKRLAVITARFSGHFKESSLHKKTCDMSIHLHHHSRIERTIKHLYIRVLKEAKMDQRWKKRCFTS